VKISARNVLRGKVKAIHRGDFSAEVVIEVAASVDVAAVISLGAVDELQLEVGKDAFAVFPAESTMVAIPHHKRGKD
jgi:molybdopterin-binding protein